jgi:hypothetical protein
MMKQAPGKAVDEVFLGGQGFLGGRIVADPIAVEVDTGLGVDVSSGAVFYFS